MLATLEDVFLGVEDSCGLKLRVDFISGDWAGEKDPKDELLLSFLLEGFNISKGFSEWVLGSLKSENRLELKFGRPQLQQCQEIEEFPRISNI